VLRTLIGDIIALGSSMRFPYLGDAFIFIGLHLIGPERASHDDIFLNIDNLGRRMGAIVFEM
jgi:hypothetical protein